MNPLLKHTLEELNKPNADPVWIIGEAFMSLLKQANENSRLNLCGGDAVDDNTAKYIARKECNKLDGALPEDAVNRLWKILPRRVISGTELRELIVDAFKYTKYITSISLGNSSCDIITPPAANIATCRIRMIKYKRVPKCAEKCSLGFDKVKNLERECEIPDYWFE